MAKDSNDPNKKYTDQEIALRGVTNQPVDPARGDTPQARSMNALRGIDESIGIYYRQADQALTGGAIRAGQFLRDSLAAAGQTGVMGNQRDLPNQGMQTPQQQGLRGVTVPSPREKTESEAASQAATTPATAPAATGTDPTRNTEPNTFTDTSKNNTQALRGMGLTDAQINMPAVGGDQQGRRAVIQGGSNGYVNLGNYGQEGQGNIYGRSSRPGSRMDTFVGAGPNAGLNAQGQQMSTGADGKPTVYNPTGYDSSNPYGGAHANAPLGAASSRVNAERWRQGLRAGGTRFGGGAGNGAVRATEIRRINQRADQAFNQALESGMNTKAASRVAESIRAGAGALSTQDRNDASRDTAEMYTDAQNYGSELSFAGSQLREQGAMTRAQYAADQKARKAQFDLFADQFGGDKQRLATVVQNAGGLDRFMNASPEVQQKLMTRGNALSQLVSNANMITAKDGTVYSTFDALSGGAKIPGSDVSIMDAIRSGNLSLLDALSGADKLELGDGTLVNKDEFFGDFDEGTLVGMSPEDRRDMIEWIDGRGE